MIRKIGTGTVFPIMRSEKSGAACELHSLQVAPPPKRENGTCPYFPTYLQVAGFLLDGVVFAQDLA